MQTLTLSHDVSYLCVSERENECTYVEGRAGWIDRSVLEIRLILKLKNNVNNTTTTNNNHNN